jgi:hypothetical protein
MYITLATRIAQWYNPIDMFLSRALNSKYIHSEIVFNRNDSFSSRGRTKDVEPRRKGVSFAEVDYHKGKWLFTTTHKVKNDQRAIVRARAKEIVGKKYDTLGAIFNAGFRLPIDKRDKFWCSEACAYALQDFYPVLKDNKITPEKLLHIVRGD